MNYEIKYHYFFNNHHLVVVNLETEFATFEEFSQFFWFIQTTELSRLIRGHSCIRSEKQKLLILQLPESASELLKQTPWSFEPVLTESGKEYLDQIMIYLSIFKEEDVKVVASTPHGSGGVTCYVVKRGMEAVPYFGNEPLNPLIATDKGWLAYKYFPVRNWGVSVVLFWQLKGEPKIKTFLVDDVPNGENGVKFDTTFRKVVSTLLS